MTHPNLTSQDELLAWLSSHHLEPSRAMGQNFLVSPEVVEAILAVLEGGPRCVTELGPGAGALTQGLLMAGFHVQAIEKDDDFAQLLPAVVPKRYREQLRIIHDDLQEVPWSWDEHFDSAQGLQPSDPPAGGLQGKPYQLVGNIPYNLSGFIVRQTTQLDPAPVQTVLLVQQEVGERMTAHAPDMNLMSLAIQLWGEAQAIMNVPAHCFWPQPKVQSQLVLLLPHDDAPPLAIRESVMAMARVFFQQKRKQMGGVLKRSFNMTEAAAKMAFEAAHITVTQRPEEITTEQWLRLREAIGQD